MRRFSKKCTERYLTRSWPQRGLALGVVAMAAACSGQPLGTPQPVAAVVISTLAPDHSTQASAAGSPTPDCTDTVRATVAIHTFLSNYNSGKLTETLNQFSGSLSGYEDGSESFMGVTLTDVQQHLTEMFAKHDQLTAPDDSLNVQVETGHQTIDYYVTLNNVIRHIDGRSKDVIGSIVLGLDCNTLKINAIAMQTR